MAIENLQLKLYVSRDDVESRALITSIEDNLRQNFSGTFSLEVVDVLVMPQKAIDNNILMTPTLVRELPLPIIKVFGMLHENTRLLAIITANGPDTEIVAVL